MAGPGGKEVARVSVRVLPDVSKFGPALEAYLERTERRLRLNLPVSLDQGDVAAAESELEILTRDRSINVDIDSNRLERDITNVTNAGSRGFGHMGLIIGGVTLAIGALASALPALLAIFGTPVVAVIAGFDGIKKAASVLSDEMDHLRASVSGVFEKLLTPGFERLSNLFPTLEDGLSKVAEGISEVFDSFTRSITTPKALQTIADIFSNIQTVLQNFARLGGMDALVNSLLTLTDVGTKVAAALSPQFVATFTVFNDQIERMAKNGDLKNGLEGIGHALEGVLILFGEVVLGAIWLFAQLEKTGEAIFNFFSKTVPEGVAAMRTAIVSDFNSLMGFLSAIPGKIVGFFRALPGQLQKIGADIVGGLLRGITGAWRAVTSKISALVAKIPVAIRKLLGIASPSRVMAEIGENIGAGLSLGMERSLAGVEASATLVANSGIRAAKASTFVTNQPAAAAPTGPLHMRIVNFDPLKGYIELVTDGALDREAFYDYVSA